MYHKKKLSRTKFLFLYFQEDTEDSHGGCKVTEQSEPSLAVTASLLQLEVQELRSALTSRYDTINIFFKLVTPCWDTLSVKIKWNVIYTTFEQNSRINILTEILMFELSTSKPNFVWCYVIKLSVLGILLIPLSFCKHCILFCL